jgi:hypothetical protein
MVCMAYGSVLWNNLESQALDDMWNYDWFSSVYKYKFSFHVFDARCAHCWIGFWASNWNLIFINVQLIYFKLLA